MFPARAADMTLVKTHPVLISVACTISLTFAQRVGAPTDDLDKLSVEELFQVQVTSVGRKAQQLSKAPAAVFVLTAEDIRRSGATTIPEALEYVPGMTVLAIDGRSWVVSARGSARLYADKILVMIDGRSLYNPLFSGIIWDSIDVPLSDVERIEIVRGPGAVMWGPNAVNGVINIITKSTKATTGGSASAGAGNAERVNEIRWGGSAGERMSYRIWGKGAYDTPAYGSPGYYYLFPKGFTYRDPSIGNLDFAATRFGFRIDGQSGKKDSWMVQGDGYKNNRQDPSAEAVLLPSVVNRFQGHTDYEGGFIQARWTHTTSEDRESALQFSYDQNHTDYPFIFGQIHNATLDFQQRGRLGGGNEIYWGGGYQQYWDSIRGRYFAEFQPPESTYRVGNVVVRDEWQMVPQRLMASAGVRLDYNSYRQLEYQPSFRLLYTPDPRQSVWFALSRAVRAPSRFDRDIQTDEGAMETPLGIPLKLRVSGWPEIRSEVERSLELGYRRQSGQSWSVDVSSFWSYYDRLRALAGPLEPSLSLTPGATPFLLMQMSSTNEGKGRSYGGEVWGSWQVRPGWRLTPSYSYLNETRWLPPSNSVLYAWDGYPASFNHQGFVRSQHELSRSLQLDVVARGRSHDRTWDLPGTMLFDARLGWRPTRSGELSLSARNLANRMVLDCYSEGLLPAIPLRRTFLVKWTQRF